MYNIVSTRRYRKSVKKIKRSGQKNDINAIERVVKLLASRKKLSPNHKDHSLHGKLSSLRECHISGDLLLMYKVDKAAEEVILVDIGSHSQIFG